jgi:hypothetical protein
MVSLQYLIISEYLIKFEGFIAEVNRSDIDWELVNQGCDGMALSLPTQTLDRGFDSFLRSLLSGEASPFIESLSMRYLRLFHVSFSLAQLVCTLLHQSSTPIL